MTYTEAIRHAVRAILNEDLTPAQIRKAVIDLIPEEYHATAKH